MNEARETSVRLVVSDVDGTLVTNDKRVTDATRAAVRRLGEHGIGFTVTSSRPPFGVKGVIGALDLTLPIGAFNGGAIVRPDLSEIESHAIEEAVARDAVARLTAAGVGVWVFARGHWLLRDPDGAYVDRERRTIDAEPTVVDDFGDDVALAGKIVGVSEDADRLAALEDELANAFDGRASVARSQAYYLDITPAGLDKGTFLAALSRLRSIPMEDMAVFGDRENDVPMLKKAGLAIAVGNASPAAKAVAHHVTASNEDDGVAEAIERIILARRP